MAIKTFTAGSVLTASDTNTYLANSGLVYVTSTSFTAATTVNVDNCFTSTYDNYRIIIRAVGSGGLETAFMRMRASGTNSLVNYYQGGWYASCTNASGYLSVNNGTAWFVLNVINAIPSNTSLDVYAPKLAEHTNYTGQCSEAGTSMWAINGNHRVSTAYDGFSLYLNATNMTGSVTVYGYRKA